MRRISRRAAVVAVLVLAVGVAGIASAAWLASGTGSGNAKATTAQALTTVDASADTTAQLFPGGTGDLVIKIHNPNSYPVQVQTITQNGTPTASGGSGTCTTTGVSLTTISGATDNVPASSTAEFTHAGKVSMSNASDDGCQGATFTIPVSLSGQSNA
jgi:hypothetical protein